MLKNGLINYWENLYLLNKKVGHRNDIFRNVEDAFVLKFGNFIGSDNCLDIGSGESIIPVLLNTEYGCNVKAIDINIDSLKTQEKYKLLLNSSISLEEQDATKLSYPDNFFDKIVAISAIEHFPNDGDSRSIKEFFRVLKHKGKCLITVPFGNYEENDKTWYYNGFERRYDLENLTRRIIDASDMKVNKLLFLSPPNCNFINEIYNKIGNIFELYYRGNYHITHDELSFGLTLGWIELTENPNSSFGALLCLEKD